MANRHFITENRAQLDHLRAFVRGVSDADLVRPMPAGWTVAAVLAHVAFWDQRLLVLLEQHAPPGGATLPAAVRESDVHWINDAAKPLMLALSPRVAADLAVSTAEAVDRRIEALPDDFVARNAAAGSPLNLLRAEHRRQHLDEIARALSPR
jgi:mycothiol maleylpyruvate isomerase-like protein